VLSERVYAGGTRLVVPLPFQELRLDSRSRLRVSLSSKLRETDPISDGQIDLTPLYKRRANPDAGAVEGTIDSVDFPNVVLEGKGRCPPELPILVQKPPAERVHVYVAEFVRRQPYDADESGNSQTPR